MRPNTFITLNGVWCKFLVLIAIIFFAGKQHVLALCPLVSNTILHVDIDAMGTNDGSTWSNAFTNLQDAIDQATSCPDVTEIWVAAGTYLPTEYPDTNNATDPRDRSFHLDTDVAIYGGFDGTETQLSARDAAANLTILSGDFDGNDIFDVGNGGYQSNTGDDNAYHVFITVSLSSAAVLDGFHIQGGNADELGSSITYNGELFFRSYGGGLYSENSSPTVINSTFSANSSISGGGGMHNRGSSPTVTNCTFTGNTAGLGGGIDNNGSSPTVTTCIFSGNTASSGGGISSSFSSLEVANSTFSENTVANNGGGIFDRNGSPIITNSTFSENTADNGGGLYSENSSPVVTNTTFTGNTTADKGGGIFSESTSTVVKNSTFSGNTAIQGGGMYNNFNSPTLITNSIFSGNMASSGGGMLNNFNPPTVMNCTFSGNTANSGGGILNIDSSPNITNCIFWGNGSEIADFLSSSPTVTFSIVQGGYVGTGNLDQDPLFITAVPAAPSAGGDLRLQSGSPAIDVGDNSAYQTATGTAPDSDTDLDGNARLVGGMIDLGPYEKGAVCPPSNVLYVNASATGTNDGTSWTNAFTDLQDALDQVTSCPDVTDIWVAAGTYHPTEGTDRSISFVMQNNLALYGGFIGTEGSNYDLNLRDFSANETILSGDIGGVSTSDNSYHVIFNNSNGLDATAILDGFTITGGNADGQGVNDNGGGIYNSLSSPTIQNCTFSGNAAEDNGGGIYNENNSSPTVGNCILTNNSANFGGGISNKNNSSPAVTNCTFSGNSANNGGGISNNASSPTVSQCTFSSNNASNGGGISNDFNSSPIVTNCTFTGNEADFNGGGTYNNDSGSSPTFSQCTFSGNTADGNGGGMYIENNSSPTVTNCIVWGNDSQIFDNNSNSTVTFSIVQGGYVGTGNLDQDPLFVAPNDPAGPDGIPLTADDGLALQPCSPAIDAGTNNILTEDILGNTRPAHAGIDMGAYEYQGPLTPLVASCQNQTVALNASGNGSLPAADLDGGSTGCGMLSFSVDDNTTLTFECTDIGTVPVTLTVENDRGQISSCQATVTVVDNNTINPAYLEIGTSQTDVCGTTYQLGDQNTLPTNSGVSGVWSFVTNPDNSGSLDDPADPFATLTGVFGGTYELVWTVSGVGCNTYEANITIGFSPDADLPGGLPDGTQDCVDECLGGTDFQQISFVPTNQDSFFAVEITSDAVIDPAQRSTPVVFQASDQTTLQPGFHAKAGSTFSAIIGDCFNPQAQSPRLSMEALPTTEVATEARDHLQLSVIPTVAESQALIRLQSTTEQPLSLLVFNQNGQLVRTLLDQEAMAAGRYEYQLQLGNFQAGMYYVKLIGAQDMQTKRLIVVRR